MWHRGRADSRAAPARTDTAVTVYRASTSTIALATRAAALALARTWALTPTSAPAGAVTWHVTALPVFPDPVFSPSWREWWRDPPQLSQLPSHFQSSVWYCRDRGTHFSVSFPFCRPLARRCRRVTLSTSARLPRMTVWLRCATRPDCDLSPCADIIIAARQDPTKMPVRQPESATPIPRARDRHCIRQCTFDIVASCLARSVRLMCARMSQHRRPATT